MKQTKETNRYEMLTQTPIPKLILRLAAPTIVSMLITGIYNSADTFFVGQIPENATMATAAVGLVFPLMAAIQAFGFFFGQGSGSFISRMLGADKKREANEMASTGFALALITGVIFAVAGNLALDQIVRLLSSSDVSPETVAMTSKYTRIILLGAPFTMGQFVVNNQLRFQGSAFYAMIGLVAGAVINMILDPVLILLLGLGVTGAAAATVIGQFISFCILLIGSRKGENIRLSIRSVRFRGLYFTQIMNGGFASLLRQGLAAASTMLLNREAGMLGGDATVAGMSIVTRVLMLLVSALIGFGQGYQPVCSFNYGAGFYDRVRKGWMFCVKWGTAFLTLVSAACLVFAPQIIALFRNDAAVIYVGKTALRFQACALPLHAVIVMTNMMLQAMGRGVKASITSSARNGLFFIPALLVLPALLGLLGLEISQAAADVCAFCLAIPFAVTELKRLKYAPPRSAANTN